jgi:cyclopropane fatty-acyl-phospholipid synthase-like methyltransferase
VRSPGPQFLIVPDLTEDALRRSGIERGTRILELGCGAGNASLRIAKLIGPSGLIVGVDRSAEVIDVAERRATVAGCCYWTRFVAADPNNFVPHERFDALVVRLTLLRQGKSGNFLRLFACVRPDGVVMVEAGAHTAPEQDRITALTGDLDRFCSPILVVAGGQSLRPQFWSFSATIATQLKPTNEAR